MFGVIAVDKPAGMTSRDVVNQVQRIAKPHKVGHTGTLDPIATGVLLLAVGRATRLVEFSHEQSKAYRGEFRLGFRSASLDTETDLEQLPEAQPPSRDRVLAELDRWIGDIEQVPPKYSAIRIAGQRAYDLARKGRDFAVPSRRVQISAIELLSYDYPLFELEICCGTGTYVRTLGSDIARKLDSDAVMTGLNRTRVGGLTLDDCVPLNALREPTDLANALHHPAHLISHLPNILLHLSEASQIRNGIPLELQRAETQLAAFDHAGQIVAILDRCDSSGESKPSARNLYRSRRVFQDDCVFHSASATSQLNPISTPQSPES